MKHVFSVAGLGLALLFVVVFFTGRIDSKHLTLVAPRVGMQAEELGALVPRIAAQTGATVGTSRRVVYLLACSGIPTSATMEARAREAAAITEKQRLTARAGDHAGAVGQPQSKDPRARSRTARPHSPDATPAPSDDLLGPSSVALPCPALSTRWVSAAALARHAPDPTPSGSSAGSPGHDLRDEHLGHGDARNDRRLRAPHERRCAIPPPAASAPSKRGHAGASRRRDRGRRAGRRRRSGGRLPAPRAGEPVAGRDGRTPRSAVSTR